MRRSWLLGVLLLATAAAAHTRSMSYSLWDLDDGGAMVRVRLSRLELTRLALDPISSPGDDAVVARLMAGSVRMRAGQTYCEPTAPPRRTSASEGYVAYRWRVECSGADSRVVESNLLLAVAPSHLHFARVRRPGALAIEKVLTDEQREWVIDGASAAAASAGMSVANYAALGIRHILTGWDHLAFVVALLLLAFTFRDIAALVTSFTLAHSITLALAVLGVIEPKGHVVEALIGFSIALVGVENAWLVSGKRAAVPVLTVLGILVMAIAGGQLPRMTTLGLVLFTGCHFSLLARSGNPARLRAAVAFAFGLIHGFGFAGIMMELDLANVRLVPALLGFNFGVEVGQLGVVILVWPLLVMLRRSATAAAWTVDLGSAAVTGLGLFWFVTRSF